MIEPIIRMLHLVSFVCWFAGLFYLPRLFVYHTKADHHHPQWQQFCLMEYRLFWYIATPSAISTVFSGVALWRISYAWYLPKWLILKMICVMCLLITHMANGYWLWRFRCGRVPSERFFRWYNEIPSVGLLCITWLVVYKPS
jgi:protoporphyrinogen IX oxidase